MAGADNGGRRVLVVEDRAHRPLGHFPTRFAELAEGLAESGCAVEVLTSEGWLHDGARAVPFVVRRYGRFDRWRYRFGDAFRDTRGLAGIARRTRTRALVHAARARIARAGDPRPDVVVVASTLDPVIGSAHAGPGRWVFDEHEHPGTSRRGARRAQRAEERRRRGGGRVRVAVPEHSLRDEWSDAAPFLDPVLLRIPGTRRVTRTDGARLRLGLSADDNVALLFGAAHDDEDVDLVARVFDDLPDWQLVVAGRVAGAFRPRRAGTGREPFVLGGYVDDATRGTVFSAADLVVLSFRPDVPRESGVLMDALSFGVPVVCSNGCPAADVVREYRLGNVFDPGNFDALARAIATAPSRIEPADLERAHAELSNRAVARRLLAALDGS
ncbi:MAG TPA: glycosyltransferase [Acidimicrobiia bacterium]|jgi:glycosyltransferase involved in cell wall biosynthesis